MIKIILCVLYVFFSVTGLVLFKYASNHANNSVMVPVLGIVLSKYSLIGLICYGISFVLYISVISKFDLGYIIPIIGGVNNILIILASVILLNEVLTLNVIIGAVIVTVGIVVMNLK